MSILSRLVRPSTRAFFREARRPPATSLFAALHGYVYGRWPYLYIGIGTGEHPLARRLAPLVRAAGTLLSHLPRRPGAGTFADTYHGKAVPLGAATRLVRVEQIPPPPARTGHPLRPGARHCPARSRSPRGPRLPLPLLARAPLPAPRRVPDRRGALCLLCRRAPPWSRPLDHPRRGGGDPAGRGCARARPPRVLQRRHAGTVLRDLQLLLLLLRGNERPSAWHADAGLLRLRHARGRRGLCRLRGVLRGVLVRRPEIRDRQAGGRGRVPRLRRVRRCAVGALALHAAPERGEPLVV